MLYSKEVITFQNTEKEVFLYLKKTRNHSFRITANKISMTLPNIYKNPDTIVKHKNELLDKIKARLHSEPEWIVKKRILDQTEIFIFNQPHKILISADSNSKLEIDFPRKTITRPEVLSDRDKIKLAKSIINHYQIPIEHRVHQLNALTVAKKLYQVDIKNNQSSWGLCSNKGEITISLNTLFAPLWVIDYIIVHELCHLVHHDHSPQFWSLVEHFYPKYKLAKKFLKEKGMELAY
jgi:predicted metal-dependent hydrolase